MDFQETFDVTIDNNKSIKVTGKYKQDEANFFTDNGTLICTILKNSFSRVDDTTVTYQEVLPGLSIEQTNELIKAIGRDGHRRWMLHTI